ncbi:sensor histidine kinase [Streptomyces sp. 058-1L]|uniref:sensor histidine kinase n=1 Tax=Streptomyces sp. 058-1L TaxID=2789266 RepID=UPI0039807F14
MLQRLDRAFDAQRRFAANASHELKTPLTGMRALLQVAVAAPEEYRLQDIGPKLLTLTTRPADILGALLTLARADQGSLAMDEVALEEVTREVVAETRTQANDFGVDVCVDCSRVRVMGDRVLLRQMTGNLVENAIRHNHRGGTVRIYVEEERSEAAARFVVRNTGRRFDPEETELMREPFHRLDSRQSGRPVSASRRPVPLLLPAPDSAARRRLGGVRGPPRSRSPTGRHPRS